MCVCVGGGGGVSSGATPSAGGKSAGKSPTPHTVDTLANILPTQQYNIVREVINKNVLDFLSQ